MAEINITSYKTNLTYTELKLGEKKIKYCKQYSQDENQ